MTDHLARISRQAATMREARATVDTARENLRERVREAADAGVPITAIAKAAGWSQRASVYNLLKG